MCGCVDVWMCGADGRCGVNPTYTPVGACGAGCISLYIYVHICMYVYVYMLWMRGCVDAR